MDSLTGIAIEYSQPINSRLRVAQRKKIPSPRMRRRDEREVDFSSISDSRCMLVFPGRDTSIHSRRSRTLRKMPAGSGANR